MAKGSMQLDLQLEIGFITVALNLAMRFSSYESLGISTRLVAVGAMDFIIGDENCCKVKFVQGLLKKTFLSFYKLSFTDNVTYANFSI